MNPKVHRGVTTIRQRLGLIAQRIDASIRTPQHGVDGRRYMLKDFTHSIVRGLPDSGPEAELEPLAAIFRYVRYGIENREDPADYDYYMGAGRAINSGGADCDDKTILLNSMLSSIGYRTGARVCSPNGKAWHIYSIVGVDPAFNGQPTRVLPCDARYGDEPGWEPADRFRRHEYQCQFASGRVVDFKVLRNGEQRGWLGLFG